MFARSTSIVVTLLIVCLNIVFAQSPPRVSFFASRTYAACSASRLGCGGALQRRREARPAVNYGVGSNHG